MEKKSIYHLVTWEGSVGYLKDKGVGTIAENGGTVNSEYTAADFTSRSPRRRTLSHEWRENVVLFTLISEKSRLYLDSSSDSTSTGFADAVTWRNSFLASPDLLSFWFPVIVPLRPGRQRRPPRAPPSILAATVSPGVKYYSYLKKWVFFFFFSVALLFDSPGQSINSSWNLW